MATIFVAMLVLQPVAGAERAGRSRTGDEGGKPEVRRAVAMGLEHGGGGGAGHGIMHEIIRELGELVEDDIGLILARSRRRRRRFP